jgi:hypothetical protein
MVSLNIPRWDIPDENSYVLSQEVVLKKLGTPFHPLVWEIIT